MTQPTSPYTLTGSNLPQQTPNGLGGYLQQAFSGTGNPLQGPPQAAYQQATDAAGANGLGYQLQGAAYQQQAAQANNPFQAQSMQQLANTQQGMGQLGAAYQQYGNSQLASRAAYQQNQDQANAQAMAAIRNSRGPNTGLAQFGGQQTLGQQVGQAGAASGAQQAAQEQAGLSGAGNAYGMMGQSQMGEYQNEQALASAQAQLQSQNQAQQNAQQLGLYGLSQGAYGQQLQGLNSYTSALMQGQGANLQAIGASNQLGAQLAAGGVNAAATGAQLGALQGGGGGYAAPQYAPGSTTSTTGLSDVTADTGEGLQLQGGF